MKNKIFFGVATVFFAVATMFNMNMLQSSNAGDISLESIMIMQKAEAEMYTVIYHGSNGTCIITKDGTVHGYRARGSWPY